VRHQGVPAVVTRLRETRLGGTLVDIRYLAGSWLGFTTSVRQGDLDLDERPIESLSRGVA
jgi:hypothetical protein